MGALTVEPVLREAAWGSTRQRRFGRQLPGSAGGVQRRARGARFGGAVLALLALLVTGGGDAAWTALRVTGPATRRRAVVPGAGGAGSQAEDNVALLFVKPHACTPKVLELVPEFLREKGVHVLRSGSIEGGRIDKEGIIDQHYSSIAKVGMARDMDSLGIGSEEAQRFLSGYSRSWDEVSSAGHVYSAVTAMEALDVSPSELLRRCLAAGYEKLKSGLYCARLEGPAGGPDWVYVLNGFYARMREKFVAPGVVVNWFVVRFDASDLSWGSFRKEVIGSTNPSDAADGSLRARIRDEWQALGLKEETNYQDNGVHSSAGPLEALREREIWLGDEPAGDPFGAAVEALGSGRLEALLANPVVEIDGRSGPAFDLLEDMDASETLEALARSAEAGSTDGP